MRHSESVRETQWSGLASAKWVALPDPSFQRNNEISNRDKAQPMNDWVLSLIDQFIKIASFETAGELQFDVRKLSLRFLWFGVNNKPKLVAGNCDAAIKRTETPSQRCLFEPLFRWLIGSMGVAIDIGPRWRFRPVISRNEPNR